MPARGLSFASMVEYLCSVAEGDAAYGRRSIYKEIGIHAVAVVLVPSIGGRVAVLVVLEVLEE